MRKYLALMLSAALLLTSCSQLLEEFREEMDAQFEEMEYHAGYDEIEWEDDYDYDEDTVWLSDFEDACYGAPVSGAAEYSADAGGLHLVTIFDRDDEYDTYYNVSYVLPEAWESTYDNPEETQLVACLTVIPGDFIEACEYEIEGEAYSLNNYSASYQTELYAADTGELIAETVLEAPAEECPMFWYFFDTNEDYYSAYDEPLKVWIKDYVQ